MSAIVCGKRSNFFEEFQSSSPSSPPPVSKRIRCSSSSPVRFSLPAGGSPFSSPLDHLISFFPDMDKQLLERALEECCNDLDSAIRSLNELRLGSVENLVSAASNDADEVHPELSNKDNATSNGETASIQDPSDVENHSVESAEWVELFVREMVSASNVDDAKARASRALAVLEKSIRVRATADAAQSFQQENTILKQQLQALIQENMVLKRAVSIQHERQKEFEDRSQELHQLKQLVAQYQEQLRTLEVNNYALTMHLKQAQQNNSIPGRFNPDVF